MKMEKIVGDKPASIHSKIVATVRGKYVTVWDRGDISKCKSEVFFSPFFKFENIKTGQNILNNYLDWPTTRKNSTFKLNDKIRQF